ncbi:MAG TPA: baseplate J/gp47 family protein [Azonexus sp.]|nr:baseplate J/gp47 family protein [Azonexus sp.]
MSTRPKFVDDDSANITQELIAAYEAMTGKTVYPAHVDRVFIDLVAYSKTLVMSSINDVGCQSLLAFSRAPIIDYLGELVGVSRLPAQSARTQVRITFAAPLDTGLAIPAGLRAEAAGSIQFQTEEALIVPAGASSVDLTMVAIEPGTGSNGLLAGQVNNLVDDLGVDVESVGNLVVTAGGSDQESDDRLRERIQLAPESFSVAGSLLAYRHHALRAHPDILDVAVLSPSPGVVNLHPLAKTGLPGAAIMDAVADTTSHKKVRPLTDHVVVLPPVEFAYTITARLMLYDASEPAVVLTAAQDGAAGFASRHQAVLGRDVVPSQIIAALSVPGVYQVELLSPAALMVVPENGWAHCTGIDIELIGGVNG